MTELPPWSATDERYLAQSLRWQGFGVGHFNANQTSAALQSKQQSQESRHISSHIRTASIARITGLFET